MLAKKGLGRYTAFGIAALLGGKIMDDAVFTESPFITQRKRRGNRLKVLGIVAVIVIFVGLVFFAGNTFFGAEKNTPMPATPTPTVFPFPTDLPTPTASPTAKLLPSPTPKGAKASVDAQSGLDRKKLTVIVHNGSGKAGAASTASQILKDAGYNVMSIGNADAFTYEDVTIRIKDGEKAYVPLLKKDLGSVYKVVETTTLDASSSADAIVIVGK